MAKTKAEIQKELDDALRELALAQKRAATPRGDGLLAQARQYMNHTADCRSRLSIPDACDCGFDQLVAQMASE